MEENPIIYVNKIDDTSNSTYKEEYFSFNYELQDN